MFACEVREDTEGEGAVGTSAETCMWAVVGRRLQQPLLSQLRGPCERRESFVDNLLVRIHSTVEIKWWTGLAPWEFGFSFSGSLAYTFQVPCEM